MHLLLCELSLCLVCVGYFIKDEDNTQVVRFLTPDCPFVAMIPTVNIDIIYFIIHIHNHVQVCIGYISLQQYDTLLDEGSAIDLEVVDTIMTLQSFGLDSI